MANHKQTDLPGTEISTCGPFLGCNLVMVLVLTDKLVEGELLCSLCDLSHLKSFWFSHSFVCSYIMVVSVKKNAFSTLLWEKLYCNEFELIFGNLFINNCAFCHLQVTCTHFLVLMLICVTSDMYRRSQFNSTKHVATKTVQCVLGERSCM